MGIAHGFRHLSDPVQSSRERYRFILQDLFQRAATHEFHDDELAHAVVFDGVHLDERRMSQRRREPRLAHEVRTRRYAVADGLDCDAAVEARVPRFIDFAEAALAETSAQLIMFRMAGAGIDARYAGCIRKSGSRHDRKYVMCGNIIAGWQLHGSDFAIASTTILRATAPKTNEIA
ncbi:hypothetical protein IA69_30660 [Massilia sp. JS1662]|nr:hypothetical protein IA69_30660 [Massilia sp. JS1662]